jgi:hypothetical protein
MNAVPNPNQDPVSYRDRRWIETSDTANVERISDRSRMTGTFWAGCAALA